MLIPARLSVLAALLAIGLTGCAYTVPSTAQQRGPRVPTVVVRDGHDRNARHDRRARALERRLERDASRYANELDRQLRLSKRQERRIERLLVNRGFDLVVQNGSRAYPFPRTYRGRLGNWWNVTDRAIAQQLDRRQRAAFFGGYSVRSARHGDRRGHRGRDHRGRDRNRDWDDDGWDD